MVRTADSGGVLDKSNKDRATPADTVKSEESEVGVIDGVHEKSLLRKLDRNLLPAVGILYLLSFLDRSNGEPPGSRRGLAREDS
jgi:hypothetical protein